MSINHDETFSYEKMEPIEAALKSQHAFNALQGPGKIERYDVYRCVGSSSSESLTSSSSASASSKASPSSSRRRELLMAKIQIGKNLNGHDGIVHGGIISLLFDETFGWAYDAIGRSLDKRYGDDDFPLAVTANLNVDFRSPLPADSNAVIRVYHERTEGRKIYVNGRMESTDGSILFSESSALFITIKENM